MNETMLQKRKTLAQIEHESWLLLERLREDDGELTPELEAELGLNDAEFVDKAGGYHCIIHNLEAEAEGADAEAAYWTKEKVDPAKARAAHRRKQVEWLKAALLAAMKRREEPKVKTELGTLRIGKTADKMRAIEIENEALVPAEYWRVKREPDLAAARQRLVTAGELPPGFRQLAAKEWLVVG